MDRRRSRVETVDAVTFTDCSRAAALMESRALRGWSRWYGPTPFPKSRPLDLWAEWQRAQHTNTSTFGKAA